MAIGLNMHRYILDHLRSPHSIPIVTSLLSFSFFFWCFLGIVKCAAVSTVYYTFDRVQWCLVMFASSGDIDEPYSERGGLWIMKLEPLLMSHLVG